MARTKPHLLEESTARRFMGLAGIGSLSDGFARNKYKKPLKEAADEEEVDEVKTKADLQGRNTGDGARLEEMPMPDDEMGGDMPPDEEVPMDEPEAGGGGGAVDVESLVTALADVIEAETGVAIDVEGGNGGGEEMPPDMGDEMGGGDYADDEMMEASEALQRAGYSLDEKSGKYYKRKDDMYEGDDDQENLAEGKEDDVKEEKDVQKEGDEEDLDEEAQNLKTQTPNNPGKVKTGSTDRVQGAQKPGPVEGSHADHALKNAPAPNLKTLEELERKVTTSVLRSLKEALHKSKVKGKVKPASKKK